MPATLTPRQAEIVGFIREHKADHGYPPTVREIGTRFGIVSPNGVRCHLLALHKKGAIRRTWNTSRAIVLVDEPDALLAERIRAERDALLAACREAQKLIAENGDPNLLWQVWAKQILIAAIEGAGG